MLHKYFSGENDKLPQHVSRLTHVISPHIPPAELTYFLPTHALLNGLCTVFSLLKYPSLVI